jgi:hypothetical protein
MKTGSQFSWDAIYNAGLLKGNVGSRHAGLSVMKKHKRLRKKIAFTAVRNPVTWYISRWSSPPHRNRLAKGKRRRGLDALGKEINDFNLWVNHILNRKPKGHLYRYYSKYIGKRFDAVKYICRQENLTEDLITTLQQIGESFDPEVIRSTEIINTALDEWKQKAKYDRKTLERLFKVEHKVFEYLGYSTRIEDYEKYLK